MTRIIDIFPEWLTTGAIFEALDDYADNISGSLPWGNDVDPASLDMRFMGHSGLKPVSPLIQMLLVNGEMTEISLRALAKMIYETELPRWEKLYATLSYEYDPIQNYSMEEKMTDDVKETEYGKTQTTTPNLSVTEESGISGFNSEEYVKDSKRESTTDGTSEVADSGIDTETRNYTLTRSGNIGVTTSQQMIQSERDLWVWQYFDTVISDIDRLLTLPIYE